MAEPTVTEQIATALSAVYAKLAEWNSRYGGGLLEDLNTNGKSIVGPARDENDYAAPIEIHHADGDVEISGVAVKVNHIETPQVVFKELPATLTSANDGQQFAFVGTATTTLTLDSGIPTPDMDTGARWNATVHNESLVDGGVLSVTAAGAETINGSTSPFVIGKMTTRIITRKDDGFQIQ